MANSMIPYSFIPGTKAKASEINANFASLAEYIENNKSSATSDIEKVNETLKTKADKTELITEFDVTDADTDLNDYKTKGTYIFKSLYTPENAPKGEAGILIVTGLENSVIKQIWYTDEENPEIYTRNYKDSTWGEWQSYIGKYDLKDVGYLKLQNGLIIQWGMHTIATVVYPIAYSTVAAPVLMKHGYNPGLSRSDSGFTDQSLTGFQFGSSGAFTDLNWIAIGY